MKLSQLTLRALAGTYMLMMKTQAVHWNVSGPLFKSVHDLTETQYEDLFSAVDDLAERIRALGIAAPMNFSMMKEQTDINPFEANPLPPEDMIGALVLDNETLAAELTAGAKAAGEFGDPATEDLFVERLRVQQKNAWMLRALLAY